MSYYKGLYAKAKKVGTSAIEHSIELIHPENVEHYQHDAMHEAVHAMTVQGRCENTRIAYDPKILEYREYCNYRYSHLSVETRYLITPDKAYDFMFYVSFRNKKNEVVVIRFVTLLQCSVFLITMSMN